MGLLGTGQSYVNGGVWTAPFLTPTVESFRPFSILTWVLDKNADQANFSGVYGGLGSLIDSSYAILQTSSGIAYADEEDTANGEYYASFTVPSHLNGQWVPILGNFYYDAITGVTRSIYGPDNLTATDNLLFGAQGFGVVSLGDYVNSTGSTIPCPTTTIMAEFAIWQGSLRAAEAQQLFSGVSPLDVRPECLFAYFPLINDLIDLGPHMFALKGPKPVFDRHPPVAPPSTPSWFFKGPAGIIQNATVAINGTGGLTAAATHTPVGATVLAGAGSIAASAILRELASVSFATLAGLGSFSASAAGQIVASASLAGTGAITPRASRYTFSSSIPIAGIGAIGPAQAFEYEIARATLAGVGGITTQAISSASNSVALAGSGSFAVSAFVLRAASALLGGAGAISANAGALATALVSENGVGSLTIDSVHTPLGATALAGAGAIGSSAAVTASASAALAGAGTFTATPSGPLAGVPGTFAGAGSLAVNAQILTFAFEALAGVGALTIDSVHNPLGAAVLAGVGAISTSGAADPIANATLAGSGALSVSASVLEAASVSLAGSAAITSPVAALILTATTITLPGVGSIVSSIVLLSGASVSLAGVGSITASTIGQVDASVILAGEGTPYVFVNEIERATVGVGGTGDIVVFADKLTSIPVFGERIVLPPLRHPHARSL